MSTKQKLKRFSKGAVVIVIIALAFTIILNIFSSFFMPVLGNEAAIGQLNNDNAYFYAMQAWQNAQNWTITAEILIWLVAAVFIIKRFYNIFKGENN
jgi:hypothetical protein